MSRGCDSTENGENKIVNYVVLDLEWNQSADMKKIIKNPVLLYGEIIQIGAVKLDENYHIFDTFEVMVAPIYYTKMHKKVSKLTGITTEELRCGLPFKTAFERFSEWCGADFVFLIWGNDDIAMLRDNMRLHNLDINWIPDTYNLQIIFDSQVTKENRQVSLAQAMEQIGENAFEAHNALNDAKSAACICTHLDMIRGLDEYTDLAKDFCRQRSDTADINEAGKRYSSRRAALKDTALTKFCCPICGGRAICTGFVRQSTDKYICIGKCDAGDEFFVRFKFSKRADGKFKAVRLIYEMDDKNRACYCAKQHPKNQKHPKSQKHPEKEIKQLKAKSC